MLYLHERGTNSRNYGQCFIYMREQHEVLCAVYPIPMVAGIEGRSFYLRECTQIVGTVVSNSTRESTTHYLDSNCRNVFQGAETLIWWEYTTLWSMMFRWLCGGVRRFSNRQIVVSRNELLDVVAHNFCLDLSSTVTVSPYSARFYHTSVTHQSHAEAVTEFQVSKT